MARRIVGIVLFAACLVALLLYSQRRERPLKVSGFIEANEIRLGSRVGGRVRAVHVVEGEAVTTGEVLLELDPFDLIERRREAEAMRDRLASSLQLLVDGPREEDIEAARAELEQAEAEAERAQSRYGRMQVAAERGAAQPDEVDEVTKTLRVARATVRARQAALDKLLAGTRPEEIAEARAAVAAAERRLDAIGRQIAELSILAPVDGTIETLDLQVGDLVPANAPVMSMMDTGELWVRAYVPQDALDMAIGQRLDVTVDSRPQRRYAGRVAFISRQAEFTPTNVQTPEERAKQVFRIKVVLEEGLDVLRPGMAADVWLDEPPEDT